MARIKGGLNAKKRHNRVLKLAKGYYGARSKQYRVAKQSVMRALTASFAGRKQKKRDFRKLWIARINAAARMNGISYSNMATNAEFPPYESIDDSQNYIGIDVDFAKAIGDKIGYEIEVSDMAFDSIITAVTSGKADFAMAGLTVTDERKQSVDFTDSYYTGKQVIIVQG